MLCWISIVGGLLIMMEQPDRSEALFYYFRPLGSGSKVKASFDPIRPKFVGCPTPLSLDGAPPGVPPGFRRLLQPFRAHVVVRDDAGACGARADMVRRFRGEESRAHVEVHRVRQRHHLSQP